jgi:hypothetical protein
MPQLQATADLSPKTLVLRPYQSHTICSGVLINCVQGLDHSSVASLLPRHTSSFDPNIQLYDQSPGSLYTHLTPPAQSRHRGTRDTSHWTKASQQFAEHTKRSHISAITRGECNRHLSSEVVERQPEVTWILLPFIIDLRS